MTVDTPPDANSPDAGFPDDGGIASARRAEIARRTARALARNPMVSPVATDRAEMFGRHDFMTPAECDALIAMIDADATPSTLFSGGANALHRTSSSCHLDAWNGLVMDISGRICRLMATDPATGETLQGQRYRPAEEYRAHCDYFPASESYWPAMRDSGGQRVWTAMIYLNDVAAGGETHFPHLGFKVPPRRGMMLMWNNLTADGAPNPMTIHAALPVEAGVKHIVTKWFRERPWRPK